jgi:hypothetical protein
VKRAKQENINKNPIPYEVVEVHLVSSDPDEVDDTGANIFVENWINSKFKLHQSSYNSSIQK